ncbi:cupin domain-containing protein [Streptomyces sp. NPDC002144]
MARMQYIRPFDEAKTFDTGFPGYRAQFVSHLESALIVASHIESGGCGPGLHYHHSDQLYYLVRGSMNVRLGDETHKIDAGTLVFIPAGLAHCNWNDGPDTETHFEIIVPAPTPGAQIALLVDSPEDVPAERRNDRPGFVESVDLTCIAEPMPGFKILPLADPASGSSNTAISYAELSPGSAGPGTHVHEFDQYYFVLEGELTVEVALEKHTVGPDTLVILPAGVPHRQYNGGDSVEKHLTILAPAPEAERPWDRGVEFRVNGEDHVGVTTADHKLVPAS